MTPARVLNRPLDIFVIFLDNYYMLYNVFFRHGKKDGEANSIDQGYSKSLNKKMFQAALELWLFMDMLANAAGAAC